MRFSLLNATLWVIASFVIISIVINLRSIHVSDIVDRQQERKENFPPKDSKIDSSARTSASSSTPPIFSRRQDPDTWMENVISKGHSNSLDNVTHTLRVSTSTDKESPALSVKNDIILIPGQTGRTMKLHTVTYASHGGRDDRFCRAVESSIRHKFDLVILGWGVKWQGLSQKLDAAHAFAAALPPGDVILFTDAFDVMFTGSSEDILTAFLAEKAPIIFSAECGCWPHVIEDVNVCLHKYPSSPTPYRYLNSGTWIGYAKEATEMLAEVIRGAGNNFAQANDQKLVADMYISGKHGIKLDFYNKLFQSMHMTLDRPLPYCNPVKDIVRTKDGRFLNERTNSKPAVLHFNGGGKAYHLKMEGQLWYKAPEHNTPEKRQQLAQSVLTVPTQKDRTLRFQDLCGDYVRATR